MKRCGQSATGVNGDVRSMWVYGLEGEELREAIVCNRPQRHRGRHRNRPEVPPPPLRPVRVET